MDEIKSKIKNLCDIRIDREGVWYYRGAEMYRTDIVEYLYSYIKKTPDGYYIEMSDYDRCRIDVEDTAFVVKSVEKKFFKDKEAESIQIHLSDGSDEELCLESLSISEDNVLYCTVKSNTFKARFSRKSYYQIARYIEYDDEINKYYLRVNGHKFYIAEKHNS